jgi:RNA polymerase sigma factor (sigma-70 family)
MHPKKTRIKNTPVQKSVILLLYRILRIFTYTFFIYVIYIKVAEAEMVYMAKWKKMDKSDRRFYRKHWTTGDPQLFDWVATQNGYVYNPFEEEDEEKRERRWDRMDQLAAALTRLKPVLRETVEWYYLEGKTFQWIADQHGVAVSTSYKRLNRAVEKLRAYIEEGNSDE